MHAQARTSKELATLCLCAKKLSVAPRNTKVAFAEQCEQVAMVEKEREAWKKDPETSQALKKSCSFTSKVFISSFTYYTPNHFVCKHAPTHTLQTVKSSEAKAVNDAQTQPIAGATHTQRTTT